MLLLLQVICTYDDAAFDKLISKDLKCIPERAFSSTKTNNNNNNNRLIRRALEFSVECLKYWKRTGSHVYDEIKYLSLLIPKHSELNCLNSQTFQWDSCLSALEAFNALLLIDSANISRQLYFKLDRRASCTPQAILWWPLQCPADLFQFIYQEQQELVDGILGENGQFGHQ